MIRHGIVLLTLAGTVVSGCIHRQRTYPFYWQLYGQVEEAGDTHFRIRHKSGHRVELLIDDRTSFVKNKQAASWQDLLRGSRVIVDVETTQDGRNHAQRVDIRGGGRPW